jgi:hypothetical protein
VAQEPAECEALYALKDDLARASLLYSDKHPHVLGLKTEIEALSASIVRERPEVSLSEICLSLERPDPEPLPSTNGPGRRLPFPRSDTDQ